MTATKPITMAHLLDGRHFGGAEQMVLRLAAAHAQMGHQPHVYCLSGGRLASFLADAGLRHRIIRSRHKLDFGMVPELARALKQDGIQVLQAHTSRTHLLARLLTGLTRVPNITTIHSPIALDENQGRARHPWRARIERVGRPWTQFVTCVSREELERLRREEHLSPARSAYVPNGVEATPRPLGSRPAELSDWLASAGAGSDLPLVAMIAQLRPRKGPEILLLALARIDPALRPGVLVIGDDEMAGRGYLEQLRQMSTTLGIANRVWFAGFRRDPWELARHARVVCLPSLFGEGLPLVALEAMHAGLSLLLSDIQGHRELVTGGNGWLHPAGDAAKLAEQVIFVMQHPEAAGAAGELGHARFLQEFALERVAGEYVKIYERFAR